MKFLQTKQNFFVNVYFAEVPEKCWLWQLTKINFHTGEKWEPRATARTNTGNLNMRNNVGLWGGSRLGEGDGTEGEVEAILHHFSTHCLIIGRIFWILPFRLAVGVKSCWRSSGVCLVLAQNMPKQLLTSITVCLYNWLTAALKVRTLWLIFKCQWSLSI